jgi:hypothetical protein
MWRKQVEEGFKKIEAVILEEIQGLIVPHYA